MTTEVRPFSHWFCECGTDGPDWKRRHPWEDELCIGCGTRRDNLPAVRAALDKAMKNK